MSREPDVKELDVGLATLLAPRVPDDLRIALPSWLVLREKLVHGGPLRVSGAGPPARLPS